MLYATYIGTFQGCNFRRHCYLGTFSYGAQVPNCFSHWSTWSRLKIETQSEQLIVLVRTYSILVYIYRGPIAL